MKKLWKIKHFVLLYTLFLVCLSGISYVKASTYIDFADPDTINVSYTEESYFLSMLKESGEQCWEMDSPNASISISATPCNGYWASATDYLDNELYKTTEGGEPIDPVLIDSVRYYVGCNDPEASNYNGGDHTINTGECEFTPPVGPTSVSGEYAKGLMQMFFIPLAILLIINIMRRYVL